MFFAEKGLGKQCASAAALRFAIVGFFFNEFTFGIKDHEQVFRYFFSAAAEKKCLKNNFLLFFCSKKVSKKGALQLEEILHPLLFKAENFKTRSK